MRPCHDRDVEIVRLWRDGETAAAIARKFGKTPERVRQILFRMWLNVHGQDIRDARRDGALISDIASKFAVSETAVKRICKNAGLD
jgi:hypothetical protein